MLKSTNLFFQGYLNTYITFRGVTESVARDETSIIIYDNAKIVLNKVIYGILRIHLNLTCQKQYFLDKEDMLSDTY